MAILLIISVVMRYFVNSPITWVDELVRYCLVALTFLGYGHVIKERKEIRTSVVDSWVPQKVALIMDFAANVVVFILMCIMVYYGVIATIPQMNYPCETLLWLKYGHVYAFIPIGCFIGIIYLFRRWYLYFKGIREKLNANIQEVE
jgi:C4-dicarboxylate transporter DctQ subunit